MAVVLAWMVLSGVALALVWLAWLIIRPSPKRAPRFSCPKCGSTYWGSATPFEFGQCAECAFRWKRVDDGLYFKAP